MHINILSTLKTLCDSHWDEIERWLAAERKHASPYIYTSVDLRHSGLRLAPVDTNLFPAGFHHLSPSAKQRASRFIARLLQESYPYVKRVLIVPENHTRNLPYLENVSALMEIFERAGVAVELGSLVAPANQPVMLQSPTGRELVEHPLVRVGDRIVLDNGYTPDVIVMNHDMTSGAPALLEGVTQPVLPPLAMGWHRRKKSVHFAAYRSLAEAFAKTFALDPWLIAAEFHQCGKVDFKEKSGLDCVARGVEAVLSRAQKKHQEYGIADTPYVFVKANSGTYGMGIMTVRSPDEVFELNKKDRNKMQIIKEGTPVSEVIIQEGVPTADTVDHKPAEPMVYMVDGVPVGGMWRVNKERDAYGNLNASGMEFTGMCDEMEDECGKWKAVDDCHFRSFGLIAAIAALAAAREDYTTSKVSDCA